MEASNLIIGRTYIIDNVETKLCNVLMCKAINNEVKVKPIELQPPIMEEMKFEYKYSFSAWFLNHWDGWQLLESPNYFRVYKNGVNICNVKYKHELEQLIINTKKYK